MEDVKRYRVNTLPGRITRDCPEVVLASDYDALKAELEHRDLQLSNAQKWSTEAVQERDKFRAERDALKERCERVERDAARYRVRRREVARVLGEDPTLYDAETDALLKLQQQDAAALSSQSVKGV